MDAPLYDRHPLQRDDTNPLTVAEKDLGLDIKCHRGNIIFTFPVRFDRLLPPHYRCSPDVI